eukprot:TRINITY_DN8607_c0_g1_i1.p1 TRINITY_DN8607_c0_g1~~TRINITY_DN8607_c0_g1_i1.p1  ORF type:complete len:121 (-),score=10.42 TRINITY_DN8607_c0_g1_i1:4-366(-)
MTSPFIFAAFLLFLCAQLVRCPPVPVSFSPCASTVCLSCNYALNTATTTSTNCNEIFFQACLTTNCNHQLTVCCSTAIIRSSNPNNWNTVSFYLNGGRNDVDFQNIAASQVTRVQSRTLR